MANKSFMKRIRTTKNGKLVVRKPGGNHFNSAEPRREQLARKRSQKLSLSNKLVGRFLRG